MKPGDYVYDPRADVNDYPKKGPFEGVRPCQRHRAA